MRRRFLAQALASILLALAIGSSGSAIATPQKPVIAGELQKRHKATLTFVGPETSETADPNPFFNTG